MMRGSWTIVAFMVSISTTGVFAQPASSRQQYALVVGNSRYSDIVSLKNPVNDAADIAATLKSIGFEVTTLLDADLNQLENAVVKFGSQLSSSQNSIGFFFYAGHGVQSEGNNYLIPVDARIQAEDFIRYKSLAVQTVLDIMRRSGNHLNLVVLDACRDNPFGWARSGSRGLSIVGTQPPGSIVVYATGAGEVALDGSGRNGVFTSELLKHIASPGIEIKEVFDRAGAGVLKSTAGKQVPAVYSQFFGKEYLAGGRISVANTADMTVTADKDGAEVFIDGTKLGTAPNLFVGLPAGKEILVEVRKGEYSAKKKLSLNAGQTNELSFTLEPEKGSLHIQLDNPGLYTLILDGVSQGLLDVSGKVNDILVGERDLELVGNGLYWQGRVMILASQTADIAATPWLNEEKSTEGFIFVSGGSFLMGSSASEPARELDEGPQRRVTVSSFMIGKYEVTVGEFRMFADATNYITDAEIGGGAYVLSQDGWIKNSNINWKNPGFIQTEKHPVTCVSWNDSIAYCNWRSDKEGLKRAYTVKGKKVTLNPGTDGYRLPTEAEWEFAAKGGNVSKGFSFSGANEAEKATWIVNNSKNSAQQVGTKTPNELGLHDMSGNVWEWCWDWYARYPSGIQTNPTGSSLGYERVLRGGSWIDEPQYVRPSNRGYNFPNFSGYDQGFRLVRRP